MLENYFGNFPEDVRISKNNLMVKVHFGDGGQYGKKI